MESASQFLQCASTIYFMSLTLHRQKLQKCFLKLIIKYSRFWKHFANLEKHLGEKLLTNFRNHQVSEIYRLQGETFISETFPKISEICSLLMF